MLYDIYIYVFMTYIYIFTVYTKILEVNLFAFAYRLFHRDFSPINGTYWAICPVTGHMSS